MKTMPTLILAIAIALGCFLLSPYSGQPSVAQVPGPRVPAAPSSLGRFQLTSSADAKGSICLFLVDTTTGETWRAPWRGLTAPGRAHKWDPHVASVGR